MKKYLALLFIFLAACVQDVRTTNPNIPTLAEKVMASTVRIESLTLFGSVAGHGSGFSTGPGTIVTAWHVVDSPMELRIVLNDDTTCEVLSATEHKGKDLATLSVDPETCQVPALEVRQEPLRLGETVYLAGNPYNEHRAWTSGVVSNLDSHLATDAPALPGMSGGPAVDAYGRVFGLVSMGAMSYGGMPYYRGQARVWGGYTFLQEL